MLLLYKYAERITYTYLIGVLALSMLPINGTNSVLNKTYIHVFSEIRLDYLLHGILLVPWMSLRLLYPHLNTKKITVWVLAGLLLAWVAEGVQFFLPYRTYNIIDLMANTLGVFAGIIIWRILLGIFK